MFLVKSAFWLTMAFIVIRPGGADVGATATALTNQAMAAGQQIVVRQLLAGNCALGQCAAPKPTLALATSSSPSVGLTMQDSSLRTAPIPRSRPDWRG